MDVQGKQHPSKALESKAEQSLFTTTNVEINIIVYLGISWRLFSTLICKSKLSNGKFWLLLQTKCNGIKMCYLKKLMAQT
jgi:hypothetical protein